MQCGYPLNFDGRTLPCGQCMPCLINKRRVWTGRILLEAQYSPTRSTFLTLTYDDHNLPPDGSVQPYELQWFVKNVRNALRNKKIRFFGVGEYGEKYNRPHYHAAMFNMDPIENEELFKDSWPNGFVHLGEISPKSAAYIASYTTKKLTKKGEDKLEGREPEFSRMSKYPPIGAPGILHISKLFETRTGSAALASARDIPSAFRVGGKIYPIGKYWRNKLREQFGITDPPQNEEWLLNVEENQIQAAKIADKLWNTRNKTWRSRPKL